MELVIHGEALLFNCNKTINMDQQQFIKDFEAEFEEVELGSLKPETELENIEEWGSL